MDNNIKKNIGSSKFFIKSLEKILKPIIKLMIKANITYPTFIKIVKSNYVNIAKNDFKIKNFEQTNSRISLLTGIHRKDVKKLLNDYDLSKEYDISLSSTIVTHWLVTKEFLNKNNRPKELTKKEFDNLVKTATFDIRSKTILDDWLNRKIVNINKENKITLNKEAYIANEDLQKKSNKISDKIVFFIKDQLKSV